MFHLDFYIILLAVVYDYMNIYMYNYMCICVCIKELNWIE